MSAPDLRTQVLAQVARIPEGRVMTYGQLALLAGHPGAARQVGYVMNAVPKEGDLQEELLRAEGVEFDDTGRCDLARYQWWPEEAFTPTPTLFDP